MIDILALIGGIVVYRRAAWLLDAMFFTDYGPSIFSTPWGSRYAMASTEKK